MSVQSGLRGLYIFKSSRVPFFCVWIYSVLWFTWNAHHHCWDRVVRCGLKWFIVSALSLWCDKFSVKPQARQDVHRGIDEWYQRQSVSFSNLNQISVACVLFLFSGTQRPVTVIIQWITFSFFGKHPSSPCSFIHCHDRHILSAHNVLFYSKQVKVRIVASTMKHYWFSYLD